MAARVDFDNFAESSWHSLAERSYWPRDNEFRNGFMRFRLYSPSGLNRARLVLTRLERSLPGKEKAVIDSDITIEHVMPQALSDEWRAALGSDAAEIHAELLHTVGNLTLTAYNRELGNKPFSEKKRCLAKSKFSLSDSITDCDEWNEETIRRRAQYLADYAVKIWPR